MPTFMLKRRIIAASILILGTLLGMVIVRSQPEGATGYFARHPISPRP